MMREKLAEVFADVWREQNEAEAPELTDDTILLDTGLDSLGFAIVVTRMEEELGYDPFSLTDEPVYPQTFGEFVAFYETTKAPS